MSEVGYSFGHEKAPKAGLFFDLIVKIFRIQEPFPVLAQLLVGIHLFDLNLTIKTASAAFPRPFLSHLSIRIDYTKYE